MRFDPRNMDPRKLVRWMRGLGDFSGSGGNGASGHSGRNGNGQVTENRRMTPVNGDGYNRESELTPDDLGTDTPEQTEEEKALCDLLQKRMRAAADSRREHEDKYREGMAFYLDDQWCQYRGGNRQDLTVADDLDRVYSVENMVAIYSDQLVNRYLSSEVTIRVSPFTGRPQDMATSRQARSLNTHFDILLNEEAAFLADLRYAVPVGPRFRYTYYDPDKVVPVPIPDEVTGEITDIEDGPAGDVCEESVTWEDIYPDPKGRTDLDEGDWLIFARRRSLAYVHGKWPESLGRVRADSSSIHDETKSQTDSISDDTMASVGSETARQYVTVITLWEQPSPRYPAGRYIVAAGDVVLESIDWPYTEMKHPHRSGGVYRDEDGEIKPLARYEYPFTMLQYKPGLNGLWGDNVITALKSAQRSRNRLISKIDEHTKNGDGKILAPFSCGISQSAFKSGRRNEVIPWDDTKGQIHEPKYIQTASLDTAIPLLIQMHDQFMEKAATLPPVSFGQEPYAGAPFAAIQALQDAANSSALVFNQIVKTFKLAVARKRLALAKQYYSDERLIYVQDTAKQSLVDGLEDDDSNGRGAASNPLSGIDPAMLGSLPPEVLEALQGGGGQGIGGGVPPAPGIPGAMPPVPGVPDKGQMPGAPAFDMEEEWENPRTEAMAFDDFAKGRYTLTAQITPPKSPASAAALVLDLFKVGAFAPEVLPATIIMLEVLEVQDVDKVRGDLLRAFKTVQKRQERMAMAPINAKADADAAASDAAAQAAQAAADAQAQMKEKELQANAAAKQQELAAKAQAERDKQEAQAEGDAVKMHGQMALNEQQAMLTAQQTEHAANVEVGKTLTIQAHTPPEPPQGKGSGGSKKS